MNENATPQSFSLHPLAVLGVSFASGIVFGSYLEYLVAYLIVTAFLLLPAAVALRKNDHATVIIAAAFFFLGAACVQLQQADIADNRLKKIYDDGRIASDDPVELEGRVIDGLRPAYGGFFLKIAAEKIVHRENEIDVSGIVRFFASAEDSKTAGQYTSMDIRNGDTVRIAVRLQREDKYLNSGVMLRRQILDQQGIDAAGTLKSPLLIEIVEKHQGIEIMGRLARFRDYLIERYRAMFSARTAGILIAVTLGDENFLDRETSETFRATGTFHILVISGLHITFIGGLLLIVFRTFTANRYFRLLGTLSFLWLFILMTGSQAPSVRAGIMFTFIIAGIMLFRQMSLLNSLGACSLVLLVYDPLLLFDASFQLTFISVIAIAVTAFPLIEKLRSIGKWTPDSNQPFPPNVPKNLRRFCETLYWNKEAWNIEKKRHIWSAEIPKSPFFDSGYVPKARKLLALLFEAGIISVAVKLWMLPLMVIYFHRVAFSEILLNVWVSTFMAVNALMAVAAVMLDHLSHYFALPFIFIIEQSSYLMLLPAEVLTNADLAELRVPVYTGSAAAIYYLHYFAPVALAVLLMKWDPFSLAVVRRKYRSLFAASLTAAIITCLMISFHPFSSPAADGRLTVDMLDVGQGDAAFITFPNGETMLIDGGGRPDFRKSENDDGELFEPDISRIGEMVVSEFLWEKGYSKVDHIVGTHSDADHLQGLTDVVKNFDVRNVYLSQLPSGEEGSEFFKTAIQRKSLEPIAAERGLKLNIGGAIVEFLYPQEADVDAILGNDGSVVLKISFGSKSFLFTGDIEKAAEEKLLSFSSDLNTDVVKVPHHGSRTSSTEGFVKAVNAKYAIIPVGKRSIFNHPHAEVVKRWQNAGATVMTTGDKGTVTMTTDGKDLNIKTFIK